jgi:tetratricopeptide (TPR) repeat protein
LGALAVAQGRTDEAMQSFQAAVKAGPTSMAARSSLAGLLASQGKFDDALSQLEALPTARIPDPRVAIALASLYNRTQRFEKTVGLLVNVTKAFPRIWEGHYLLGEAYLAQERTSRRAARFRRPWQSRRKAPQRACGWGRRWRGSVNHRRRWRSFRRSPSGLRIPPGCAWSWPARIFGLAACRRPCVSRRRCWRQRRARHPGLTYATRGHGRADPVAQRLGRSHPSRGWSTERGKVDGREEISATIEPIISSHRISRSCSPAPPTAVGSGDQTGRGGAGDAEEPPAASSSAWPIWGRTLDPCRQAFRAALEDNGIPRPTNRQMALRDNRSTRRSVLRAGPNDVSVILIGSHIGRG